MHRYQVWVTCAILLALTSLSGLYVKQVQSADNDTRPIHSEDFSTLSNLDYLKDIHLDKEGKQLTLQLDDHIAQQESVVVTHEEDIYVIWRDLRNDKGDIYIQKLNADGQRMWSDDQQINNSAPRGTTQSTPSAAMDNAGNLWVVWVDDRLGQNDLYAQYLTLPSESGNELNLLSADLRIPQTTEVIYQANQAAPAVATYGTDLIVVWHDNRNGIDFDIYAQRIGTDGQSRWPNNDGPIHTNATGSQSDPTIAINDAGNIMVAWLDQRTGNGAIYYTRRSSAEASVGWSTERQANQAEHSARKPPMLVMSTEGVAQICWLSSTDTGNHVYLQTIQNTTNQTALSNQMITTASVNSAMKPAVALLGNKIAVGWKAINDGHLYVNIRDVGQSQDTGASVVIDKDGLQGNENRSQTLRLTALGDNEFFAVWVDSRGGRKSDIYGQKLGADGTPAWSSSRFINDSIGRIDQQNPAVAVDNQDNSIVAWYSERGGQSNLFLQKFSSEGEPVWNRQIPVSNAEIQGESLKPDLAVLNNDILVTWSDSRSGFSRIYVQRFDPEGNRAWHTDQLASRITDPTFGQFNPQIAVDNLAIASSTDIFITWQESDGAISRIALQKFDGEGLLSLPVDHIVAESNIARLQFPALALTNEQVVMGWASTILGSTDLYLQTHSKEDGTLLNGSTRVNDSFIGLVDQLNPPALAADPNGNMIVVWTDRRQSAIYARGYNSQLIPRWEAMKLNQTPGSFSPTPDIAFVPNTNDMVVVWQGLNQSEFFVYAQRINAQGESQWQINALDAEMAIKVSGDRSQEAWLPAIAVGASGTSSIVWREERNKNEDIYLQRLNGDGEHWRSGDVLVIDPEKFYRSEGFVRSSLVDGVEEQIGRAVLTYQGDLKNSQAAFMLTNNDGTTWESIKPGKIHTFTSPGIDLRWQVHLTQTNVASLGQAPPFIDSLQIASGTISPTISSGDAYEPDDECGSAWPIQPDGIVQAHTLHNTDNITDVDWISFQAALNTDYILLATPEGNDETLQVDIYIRCSELGTRLRTSTGTQNNPAHLFLSGIASGEYYVQVSSGSTEKETVAYNLSIRPAPSSGQGIVVRGFHDDQELFQVDQSADRVNNILEKNGFTLHYLNYERNPDMMQKLEEIAQQNILADTVLMVYLVGQIDATGGFQLTADQSLTPSDLDLWLSNLENAGKIRNATVVIEANSAGSFIETLSQPNRVIVMSTGVERSTEQTANGFLFSDTFWSAMGQGYSVQQSSIIASQVVEEIGIPCPLGAADCQQVPPLVDMSNQAQMIGLRVSNTLTIPAIGSLSVSRVQTDSLMITITILPDFRSIVVEARIRSTLGDTGEIIGSPVELKPLTEQYSGILTPKPKNGPYQIAVYGWDNHFALRPRIYEYQLKSTYYLPFISSESK